MNQYTHLEKQFSQSQEGKTPLMHWKSQYFLMFQKYVVKHKSFYNISYEACLYNAL